METLFGHLCSDTNFSYDKGMQAKLSGGGAESAKSIDRQQTGPKAKNGLPVLAPSSLLSDDYFNSGKPSLRSTEVKALKLHSRSEDPEKYRDSGSLALRKKARAVIHEDRSTRPEPKDDPRLMLSFAGWLEGRSKESMPSHDQSNPTEPRTKSEAIELPSNSASETESEADKSDKIRCVDLDSGLIPQRSANGTPLSLFDLAFEGYDKAESMNPKRYSHLTEVYRGVSDDDGFSWGRDCGLLSSTIGCEDDDEL
ncbi:MAG: hypothetical protein Q9220_005591 [cf. Caloplaca sp. 1 TL-2023]